MIFSTDYPVDGLQSLLKIRGKPSKLFALKASPHKGSKQRVNLNAFVFSTIVVSRILQLLLNLVYPLLNLVCIREVLNVKVGVQIVIILLLYQTNIKVLKDALAC